MDDHNNIAVPADVQNAATVSGLGATDLESAYKVPTTGAQTGTVAIVDAYDYPNAEKDLAVYRTQFGLPACTTANGCFKKVNQSGQASPLPSAAPSNDDWTEETALDLDMVSAGCPGCKILLVEADDDQGQGLFTANTTAASLGANVISNSWGDSTEPSDAQSDEQYFTHTGVTTFFASGDDNTGASYPSSSLKVITVGGTALAKSSTASRGWVETVWHGSQNGQSFGTGSGCSAVFAQPSWQTTALTGCSKRAFSDISAEADINIATYDTSNGNPGWYSIGGTSAASPLVAAIFVATGHGAAGPSFPYSNTNAWFDVTSGNNGTCSISKICNAGTGWDGPTGFGTPNGAVLAGSTSSPSFSIDTNPTNITVQDGSSSTVQVVTTASGGSTQSIALTVSGLPTGVTGTISPTTVTAGGTATLTLKATATAAATTASFSVKGTSGSETETATPSITVSTTTPPPTDGGTNPPPPGGSLSNGVPVTGLSGAKSAFTYYSVTIPSGASNLVVSIAAGSGSTGDADLYVKAGAQPTTSSYDCRPYVSGSNESCTVASPVAGTYYVGIRGYSAYTNVTLTASWSTSGGGGGGGTGSLSNGVPVTGISGAKSSKTYYTFTVPSGAASLNITITGSTSASNDADLYVKLGSQPTTSSYDCRPYKTGSNEGCTATNPTAGTYYILLNGYSAYSGVTLEAQYQ